MNLKEDLPKNKYIEKAYDLIINNEKLSNEEIHLLIVESNFDKNTFGWRLFEHITKNAKNYHSVLYKDFINSLKTFFKLFPDNKKALRYTYKGMFANMVLGLGRTGFSIRTKNELERVLADFKQLGFSCSKYEVFKVIYNKLLKKRGIISHYHFEKLSYFLDFEDDLESLLSGENEEILIIATLAEKYKDNKFYRFKNKGDRKLLSYYIDEARKIKEKNYDCLKKKSELYLRSIKIAMAYDDNIIQFCFSKYFYINAQICYFSDNKILSLISYDFAQYFFKLRKKKYEQKLSEAYYYEGLAYFYKKEKRFEDQEIALASYVKSYKDLISFTGEKYIKSYYRSLLKYIYVKVKNSLYKNEFQDCINICNNFLKNQYKLISSLLNGKFVEDIFFIIKAYKEEAQGRLLFEQSDFSNALKRVEQALHYQNKRSKDHKFREIKNLKRYKLYLLAREYSLKGNNKSALKILKQLFQLYNKFEYIPFEYVIFYQILKSKYLIERGKISLANNILKSVIENEKVQESYRELYDNSKELYGIIINYNKSQFSGENLDILIFDAEDSIDKINLWNYKQYSLPIQQIETEYLKIDIMDDYFSHIINQFERRIGIHISKDISENYPIFEKIILNYIKVDEKAKEYIKMYSKKGQTDPILISYYGSIIDGNKRLATIKLSRILDSELMDKAFISNNIVKIVQLPKDLPYKELSKIKSEINNQSKYELNKPFDIKDLRLLINLVNNVIKHEEICEIFNIDLDQISFYRSLYALIEEFLIENELENDFYIVKKFEIFEHFDVLNSELLKLGVYTGKGGRDLILMKEKIKNMTFLWLRNNIDKKFISKKMILKAKMIKKFKFIFNDPIKSSIIDNILYQEIKDKKQIQILLTGLVNKIKISEERRSCLEHTKLILNRIGLLRSKMHIVKLSSFEKEEIFKLLEESNNNLSKLILTVKNN